jgi:hypothetical protein
MVGRREEVDEASRQLSYFEFGRREEGRIVI